MVDRRRIVVGVDGSPAAAAALRWAIEQARVTGADVVEAVIAWELPGYYALAGGATPPEGIDPEHLAAQVLSEAVERVTGGRAAVPVLQVVLPGLPSAALLAQARAAELVVVGSRGLGGFAGVLLGSVSRHVLEHAPCPAVVVRPARSDRGTGEHPVSGG
ncbi:nucleotide-binding universal stress UspA family protein [Kitasatospora sp. GAS204A]|uniref:universal stress protein n=1 Tax=unclassified Kitasatospora TaxID=2633591 RepID=UPI00247328C5|nr:universal stress protein [Kitasatospora sp. GAS204B]MDH6121125.1 nucleotide-binding universal stress UspA family protein [Kitasatospora sp. GAS204B]